MELDVAMLDLLPAEEVALGECPDSCSRTCLFSCRVTD
jgi:hypothetical protein